MTADSSHVRIAIHEALTSALRNSGRAVPSPISDDLSLADGLRLDSLDFAVVVVELERKLGCDPFRRAGATARTVGDLIRLYESHASGAEAR